MKQINSDIQEIARIAYEEVDNPKTEKVELNNIFRKLAIYNNWTYSRFNTALLALEEQGKVSFNKPFVK